jgi:hypothetical protein
MQLGIEFGYFSPLFGINFLEKHLEIYLQNTDAYFRAFQRFYAIFLKKGGIDCIGKN